MVRETLFQRLSIRTVLPAKRSSRVRNECFIRYALTLERSARKRVRCDMLGRFQLPGLSQGREPLAGQQGKWAFSVRFLT